MSGNDCLGRSDPRRLRAVREEVWTIFQSETEAARKLYENAMSCASHGLFFHEGLSLGGDIAGIASKAEERFETCRSVLIERG